MKSRLSLFLVLFMLGITQSSYAQNNPYTFTIHLGAFMDAKAADFADIQSYGYLYQNKLNNLNQIYMGDYTSESDAMPILEKVKNKGYVDAFVTRRRLSAGGLVTVIQLGQEPLGKSIEWKKYASAGPLYAYQKGNVVGIVTGPFGSLDEAQKRMEYLRKTSFADAFIKDMNSVLLHEVDDFQTGGRVNVPNSFEVIADIPDNPAEEVLIAEIPAKQSPIPNFMVKKRPNNATATKGKPAEKNIPKTYENAARITPPASSRTLTAKGTTSSNKEKAIPAKTPLTDTRIVPPPPLKKTPLVKTYDVPFIRPKVKRTSALRLQEILKEKGAYKSGLDGYYGAGTKKAYDKVMAEDQEIQKYKLLTALYQKEETQTTELEKIIVAMEDNVSLAVGRLKGYRSPLADAFQAYGIYELAGANKETNRLMNKAVKASVGNKKNIKLPSNYTSHEQLLEYLSYVYETSNEKIVVPCWLFNKHPRAAFKAFSATGRLNSGNYSIQDCGNITAWESIQLLETVMKDMTPDLTDVDQKNIAQAQSTRAKILLNPQAQNVQVYKMIDRWNTNLWAGLDQWEAADPLHSRIATPLRITYFQSWALLEDHFMNKGLKPKAARGLALEVLRTIVDPYLARYSKA